MSDSPRCLYSSEIKTFLTTNRNEVLGILCDGYHGVLQTTQSDAWGSEITILQEALLPWKDSEGKIIFEYDIPRLGKRIDVVVLLKGIIFCIEFKVGESDILQGDVDQVLDYALDLKNFHKYSEDRVIVPILVATRHDGSSSVIQSSVYDDRVVNPLMTGEKGITNLITDVLERFPSESPVNDRWIISPYAPTPTIIEAARTLYESHSVHDITRHEADQVTTDQTIAYILDVIHKSKRNVKVLLTLKDCLHIITDIHGFEFRFPGEEPWEPLMWICNENIFEIDLINILLPYCELYVDYLQKTSSDNEFAIEQLRNYAELSLRDLYETLELLSDDEDDI